METKDLLKKVRKIEIKTRRLSDHIFGGEYQSTFKGKGMTFSEVRQYQIGDDVRAIDWNVTARYNEPYIKVFDEEREQTLMLMVDVSGSKFFGTNDVFKNEYVTEIAATLSFSANQNNDKIGAILFSDQIELYIPPKKGRKQILRIIRELIEFKPKSTKTDIGFALRHFNNIIKKRCIAFLISDFIDEKFEDALKITAKKHDLIALRIADEREKELPNIGLSLFIDPETGKEKWINTNSKKVREKYRNNALLREHYANELFKKSNVDFANINLQDVYIKPLMQLFKKR